MELESLPLEFHRSICSEFALEQKGPERYLVHTPFKFDDGDHFKVVLKRDDAGIMVFSDEGQTKMQLSYEGIDLDSKIGAARIDATKKMFGIEDRDGELVLPIRNETLGLALFFIRPRIVEDQRSLTDRTDDVRIQSGEEVNMR
jgi:hypothetical protein